MATYYVTSADVGAPALSGVNGSGITVFNYILNTIAGLSILYTGTNRAVYQMSNGDVLRCYHDSAASGFANLMIVRAAESATGVDSLVDPYPTVALMPDANCNWIVSSTANAATRSWWALVDTTNHVFFFNVAIDVAAGTAASGFRSVNKWVGDGGALLPVDNYCAFLTTRNATSGIGQSQYEMMGLPSTGLPVMWWKRSRDGTIKSIRGYMGPYTGGVAATIPSGPIYPDPDDGKLRKARATAGDNYSQTATAGAAPEIQRCYIPHSWTAQHIAGTFSAFPILSGGTQTTFTDGALSAQVGTTVTFQLFPIGGTTGSSGADIWEITDTFVMPSQL